MKHLTLVRHGQAEWKESAAADFDRPLTRRGLAEALDMARRLRARDLPPPGLIMTSPARRAVETAEAIARESGLTARVVKRIATLYLASPAELADAIRATGPRVSHLLIVGHNPGISDFARQCAPAAGIPSFATGASCILSIDSEDWRTGTSAIEAHYGTPGRFFDLWH